MPWAAVIHSLIQGATVLGAFRYKLFGDEQHPLLFEGQAFDWEPMPHAPERQHTADEASEHQLAQAWDSFLTVGITESVATHTSGMGWAARPQLEVRGLDGCLGAPHPSPNATEWAAFSSVRE